MFEEEYWTEDSSEGCGLTKVYTNCDNCGKRYCPDIEGSECYKCGPICGHCTWNCFELNEHSGKR